MSSQQSVPIALPERGRGALIRAGLEVRSFQRAPRRAPAMGPGAKRLAANNDGCSFFSVLDDLVMTGPTRTSVDDHRVILIG